MLWGTMIHFQNIHTFVLHTKDAYRMAVMLKCTPRCYNEDTYIYCIALHCYDTISKRKGCISHGCHTKMHTKMLQ